MSNPDAQNPAAGKSTGNAGAELPAAVQEKMEKSFGADLSDVRVHPNASLAQTGGGGARAYTKGKDIFFKSGEYSPGTAHGDKLLAHELTHVVQQKQGRMTPVQADPKTGPAQADLASQLAAGGQNAALK